MVSKHIILYVPPEKLRMALVLECVIGTPNLDEEIRGGGGNK